MNVLMINAVPYGSPAKIMYGIALVTKEKYNNVYTATGYSAHPSPETPSNNIIISGILSKYIHMKLAKYTGFEGFFSILSTIIFIRKIRKLDISLIHIHNLHGWYINLPIFFNYIKKNEIPVVWTMHDCWSFTGHCTYFEMEKCEKWKKECKNCSAYKGYPISNYDNSRIMYRIKKELFTSNLNLTIITPSIWLSRLVKESFLSKYNIKVINNGIDLNTFKPTITDKWNTIIDKSKFVILGVSIAWSKRKGLDVFIELVKLLPDNYQIVLVGTTDRIDELLPKEIISIHSTNNQKELAEIYSLADVFVNPTREENFPTVNIESLACGTPIITYNTGGSVEIINESCGTIIESNEVVDLYNEILNVCKNKPFRKQDCLERAYEFDRKEKFIEYKNLYNYLVEGE